MLSEEFRQKQVTQIQEALLETRVEIEERFQREEYLLEQLAKWTGRVVNGHEPFLIGLPSLYIPEQPDGNSVA